MSLKWGKSLRAIKRSVYYYRQKLCVTVFSKLIPRTRIKLSIASKNKIFNYPFIICSLFVREYRFGLFEAMSAIEMMDPKMDAGMLCNKAKKVLQFEPAVKACRTIIGYLTAV